MGTFTNPILPGCYPDPSVCRVGDQYFLVTSTFEYFPGLPVFRSRDLVNWEQLGHAIDRHDQLDLSTVPSSGGLFAPTIRHHDGVFYIVNTLVGGSGRGGNFVVTATDAAGPWSDPIWLDDAPGIDPSLFFDDDHVWMCGTRRAEPGLWEGHTDVWLRELDLAAMRLTGPEHLLWRGALVGARWAEGPHLYRVDERYYLLAAEGGTERNHAISVAVSDDVTGPYVGDPANPVLTHRMLGSSSPVMGVGHADLVQTPAGEWWAVMLATRTVDGSGSILGRETNLAPVTWEDGWPVFSPGVGRLESVVSGASVPSSQVDLSPDRDDFNEQTLGLEWNLLRTSAEERYSLAARPGWLRLPLLGDGLDSIGTPAFIGRRLAHLAASARASFDFMPTSPAERAGLVVRQSEDAYVTIEITADGSGERRIACRARLAGQSEQLGVAAPDPGEVVLGIRVDGNRCSLGFDSSRVWHEVATTSVVGLGSEAAGGFIGVWIGMFASSDERSSAVADIDWFEYRPHSV